MKAWSSNMIRINIIQHGNMIYRKYFIGEAIHNCKTPKKSKWRLDITIQSREHHRHTIQSSVLPPGSRYTYIKMLAYFFESNSTCSFCKTVTNGWCMIYLALQKDKTSIPVTTREYVNSFKSKVCDLEEKNHAFQAQLARCAGGSLVEDDA